MGIPSLLGRTFVVQALLGSGTSSLGHKLGIGGLQLCSANNGSLNFNFVDFYVRDNLTNDFQLLLELTTQAAVKTAIQLQFVGTDIIRHPKIDIASAPIPYIEAL